MYIVGNSELELDSEKFPLDRYKPIEKLGQRTSGLTYLCHDELMDEQVVVKVLHAIEFDQFAHFQREAAILCKVQCKSIAQVLDFGATASGTVYLVWEYQDGTSLHKYMRGDRSSSSGPATLSPELAYRTFIPIAEALSIMNSNGVLHRDVKPTNILVRNLEDQDCAVYLIDSGAGRVKHATLPPVTFEGRTVYGAPIYITPEQLLSQRYDARSEIFAFGLAFFEALIGRLPFDGPDAMSLILKRNAPSLTQASENFSYSLQLEEFAKKCLERNPDARYKNMQEVVVALRDLVKSKTPASTVKEKPHRKRTTGGGAGFEGALSQRATGQGRTSEQNHSGSKENYSTSAENYSAHMENDPAQAENYTIRTDNHSTPVDNSSTPVEDYSTPSDSNSTAYKQRPPRLVVSGDEDELSKTGSASQNAVRSRSQNATGSGTQNAVRPQSQNGAQHKRVPHGGRQTPEGKKRERFSIKNVQKEFRKNANELRKVLLWCGTSKQGLLSVITIIVVISIGYLTTSYMSYLTAPRIEQEGVIYSYEPATQNSRGSVELGQAVPDDFGRLVRIEIEEPQNNLPVPVKRTPWTSELNEEKIWENDQVNLQVLKSTTEEKPIQSDLRLGEMWKVTCRQQDGKLYLEKTNYGVAPLSQSDLQEVHLTLSKMYSDLAHSANVHDDDLKDEGADLDWIQETWAAKNVLIETDLTPPKEDVSIPELFPSKDLKLVQFSNGCTVLMRTPSWMTKSGFLFVTLHMNGNNAWRVTRIAPATQKDWDRR